jgi:hypothetical protein
MVSRPGTTARVGRSGDFTRQRISQLICRLRLIGVLISVAIYPLFALNLSPSAGSWAKEQKQALWLYRLIWGSFRVESIK